MSGVYDHAADPAVLADFPGPSSDTPLGVHAAQSVEVAMSGGPALAAVAFAAAVLGGEVR